MKAGECKPGMGACQAGARRVEQPGSSEAVHSLQALEGCAAFFSRRTQLGIAVAPPAHESTVVERAWSKLPPVHPSEVELDRSEWSVGPGARAAGGPARLVAHELVYLTKSGTRLNVAEDCLSGGLVTCVTR